MTTPLAALLGDVRAASAFCYDARDSAGNRMDTAKVIPGPAGGYLAVHGGRGPGRGRLAALPGPGRAA